MMEISRSLLLTLAAIMLAISGGLWLFGVIPWWGILLAVPLGTLALLALLIVLFVMAWTAGGSH